MQYALLMSSLDSGGASPSEHSLVDGGIFKQAPCWVYAIVDAVADRYRMRCQLSGFPRLGMTPNGLIWTDCANCVLKENNSTQRTLCVQILCDHLETSTAEPMFLLAARQE